MFRNSLMTAPFYLEKKIKVRFSSSWLSVYTKDTDLQSIPMTSRVKNGCHWLSEKCMTTNDNENTGWSSEELIESKKVNLPLTTMTTIFSLN